MKLLFFYYHGCKSTIGKRLIQFQLHWLPIGNAGDVGANALLFTTEVQTFVEVCKWGVPQQNLYTASISVFFFYLSEILGVLMCSADWGARPLLSKSNLSRRERSGATREKQKTKNWLFGKWMSGKAGKHSTVFTGKLHQYIPEKVLENKNLHLNMDLFISCWFYSLTDCICSFITMQRGWLNIISYASFSLICNLHFIFVVALTLLLV